MLDEVFQWSVTIAAFCAALVAGVFLTFSDFVMWSLRSTEARAGVEAMQSINRGVLRSVFMALLLGSAFVSIAIAGIAWLGVDGAAAGWMAAGSAAYLAGVMAVTVLRNVPMNERLDGYDYRSWAAQFYWPSYCRSWTRWNHVRSGAALVAAGCYFVGALLLGRA